MPKLLKGSIYRSIWFLAIPAIGSSLSQMLFDMTNAFWVAKLGDGALAALTLSAFMIWALYSLTQGLSGGITALIARRTGEGKTDAVGHSVQQALGWALLLSFILMPPCLWIVSPLMHFMSQDAQVVSLGIPFLNFQIYTLWSLTLFLVIEAVFIGKGNTRSPMLMTAFTLGLNMILDPCLIFGWYGFPQLGFMGAAWGSFIAKLFGISFGLILLAQNVDFKNMKNFFPQIKWVIPPLKIGLPNAMSGVLYCAVFVGLSAMLSGSGTEAQAAMGIGQRIESVIYSTIVGFAIACTTLVGQNMGAGQYDRAEQVAWKTAALGSGFAFVTSVIFLFWAEPILFLFTQNPLTLSHGANYLWYIGINLIPFAFELVLMGAFSGAGNTLPPMYIIGLGTLLRLPLGWYYAFHLGYGATGIWIAISLSMLLKGSLMAYWFEKGRWKLKQI